MPRFAAFFLSLSYLGDSASPQCGSRYPSRLRRVCEPSKKNSVQASLTLFFFSVRGERGIRTPGTLPYTCFRGRLLQPLGHLTR